MSTSKPASSGERVVLTSIKSAPPDPDSDFDDPEPIVCRKYCAKRAAREAENAEKTEPSGKRARTEPSTAAAGKVLPFPLIAAGKAEDAREIASSQRRKYESNRRFGKPFYPRILVNGSEETMDELENDFSWYGFGSTSRRCPIERKIQPCVMDPKVGSIVDCEMVCAETDAIAAMLIRTYVKHVRGLSIVEYGRGRTDMEILMDGEEGCDTVNGDPANEFAATSQIIVDDNAGGDIARMIACIAIERFRMREKIDRTSDLYRELRRSVSAPKHKGYKRIIKKFADSNSELASEKLIKELWLDATCETAA